MPYLVGVLERHHSDWFPEDSMHQANICLELKKEDLIKAKNDENFQVINLTTQEFYNPVTNKWQKFNVKQ